MGGQGRAWTIPSRRIRDGAFGLERKSIARLFSACGDYGVGALEKVGCTPRSGGKRIAVLAQSASTGRLGSERMQVRVEVFSSVVFDWKSK